MNHTPDIIRPYALMDLDDTLFQTKRKLGDFDTQPLSVASVNKQGEPLSFFTAKQANFFHWLNQSTTLIPVTARDTTEIKRVKLPFYHHKVLTHGAVILDGRDKPNPTWQMHIKQHLLKQQTQLQAIARLLDDINRFESKLIGTQALSVTPHSDTFNGENLTIYLAVKHKQKKHHFLETLAISLPQQIPDGFYIHHNANNLAILPKAVHKCHAVEFLLQNVLNQDVPTFGFGDSLADLPFLQRLDWYGTPNKGQLHDNFAQFTGDNV